MKMKTRLLESWGRGLTLLKWSFRIRGGKDFMGKFEFENNLSLYLDRFLFETSSDRAKRRHPDSNS